MALAGEITGHKPEITCDLCKRTLKLEVLHSGGGYYIGYWCPECGPYGRESSYYSTRQDAEAALKSGRVAWRNTDYNS